MKKLIPFVVLLVGVAGAMAQGVNFRNNQSDFTTTADRDVYNIDGTPLIGTNFQSRLLYASVDPNDPALGSLRPATYPTPTRFRAVTTGSALAGTWSGADRTLAGFAPGQTVRLQVQVWDGPGSVTFDEARAAGGTWGESLVFTYTIPAAGTAPGPPFYMDNLRSFTLVPEPSVIGLGLVGIGALFMLRRRKA